MHHHHDLQKSLFFLIKWTARKIKRQLNCKFTQSGHNITSEQWRILKCLQHEDGQRQQDLADLVHKDKTSITRIIDSMEKRDLVVRIPDKSDRRQKLAYLTNKGKRSLEEMGKIFQKILLETQEGIEPEKIEICMDVLKKINRNLSDS